MLSRARDEQTWEVQPSLVPSFSLFFILSFLSFHLCLSFIFLFCYFLSFLFFLFSFIFYLFFFLFFLFFFVFYLNKSEKIFWEDVYIYIYFTYVLLRPLISITPIVAFNKLNLLYVMIDKKGKISKDA